MRRFSLAALALCGLVGCGERPAPVGPAAEASTAAIEITMDAPATESGSTASDGLLAKSELTKLEMEVPNMACEVNCPPAVRTALLELPGVAEVEVDFATKTATCRVDPSKFDSAGAIEKLAQTGYKDSKVKN